MKNNVKNCINLNGMIQMPDSIEEKELDELMDLIIDWAEERGGHCVLYFKPMSFEDWAMEDID